MTVNIEPLRKVLELEHKKCYEDSAVIGGLDKFLHNWSPHASGAINSPRLLRRFNQLVNPDYASLTKQQRREWAKNILNFSAEVEQNGTTEKVPEKQAPSVQRRKLKIKDQPAMASPSINAPITAIKGISSILATKFNKLGVQTIRDLLYFFPYRHLDYSQRKTVSQLAEGYEQTITANVWQAKVIYLGGRRSTEAIVGDATGNVRVVWFNNPYLAKKLVPNMRLVISGKVGLFGGRYVFESPEWELAEDKELIHTGRLIPLYSLTQGLRPRQMRKLMKEVVDQWAWHVNDFLPSDMRVRCKLLELPEAINQAHYPDDETTRDQARVRLAFDELFLLQLGVLGRKRDRQEGETANPLHTHKAILDAFLKSLPYELTQAQHRVLTELLFDLKKPQPMSRLLQGEVGSGKTIVATAALLMAAVNGSQGAFMAPTEILAEQHFNNICELLSQSNHQEKAEEYLHSYSGLLPEPVTVALLIGDIKPARKQEIQQLIQDASIDIVIGTHALIQKDVEFSKLGLVVVDEQHRFGVKQRSTLRQKGSSPHVLVMTATPIPRTLALTLYGDLELSVIDQLPPGRQTIKTKWLQPVQRDKAYSFISRQVTEGRQAFIICPLVEESEAIQAKAAVAEYQHLSKKIFPELRLGLLHGRMSSADKDAVMRRFRSGELNILVSTPVVEVGIDVPNATVMLIESADRFGLSQLHQFRGRVGRGQEQSYCLLLTENPSIVAKGRLDILENVQDGFVLAEEDLKLRGPGEFFGTRQSGLPDLRMAKLSDVVLLELARREATKLFQIDRNMEKAEHQPLAEALSRVWKQGGEWS